MTEQEKLEFVQTVRKTIAEKAVHNGDTVEGTVHNYTVDKSVLLDLYQQRGIDDSAIKNYADTTTAVLRGLHYAATDINIGHIKKCVAEKKDPRKERTTISGVLGRHITMRSSSTAFKSGELTLKNKETGEPAHTTYRQFNAGSFSLKVSTGKGCPEIDDEQKKTTEELIKSSGFSVDGEIVDSTAE